MKTRNIMEYKFQINHERKTFAISLIYRLWQQYEFQQINKLRYNSIYKLRKCKFTDFQKWMKWLMMGHCIIVSSAVEEHRSGMRNAIFQNTAKWSPTGARRPKAVPLPRNKLESMTIIQTY